MKWRQRHLSVAVVVSCIALSGCGDLNILTTSIPDGEVGVPYSVQLQGENVDSWSLTTGVLPPGIGLNRDGLLSGTPSLAGIFPFTVSATRDGIGPSGEVFQGLSLTVR